MLGRARSVVVDKETTTIIGGAGDQGKAIEGARSRSGRDREDDQRL
jgi:hypothetical protein